MNAFVIVFLAALALATATRLWLASRHVSHIRAHRGRVPNAFASKISLDSHQKAADYTCAKTRLVMTEVIIDAAILLVLTFGGVLQLLHDLSAAWLPEGVGRGVLLIALVGIVASAVDVPFSLYRIFVIEQRFGFNKMTLGLFFLDLIKGLLLGATLLLPLAAGILWLIQQLGAHWWVYGWVAVVIYGVVVTFIAPTLIAPLFNKFSPLQNQEIKERIQRLAERCGFKIKGLMVMDGSRRSAHGNAYFTGFGSSKRIVFFDTLLAQLNPPEVEAVLAHELGHYKLRHVIKRMAWSAAFSLAFFWLFDLVMQSAWFFHGLGVASPSPAMALLLFSLVLPLFVFLLQPLGSMYSRKHEFEADQYAASHASARDLVSALIKLYRDNAATLTPDPVHSAFYDSHPPAIARIARLQKA